MKQPTSHVYSAISAGEFEVVTKVLLILRSYWILRCVLGYSSHISKVRSALKRSGIQNQTTLCNIPDDTNFQISRQSPNNCPDHGLPSEIRRQICGNKMPTRCNRGFYCRSYCLLNMFRAPLCPSLGAQEYYTVAAACGISCCGFQVAGLVWS